MSDTEPVRDLPRPEKSEKIRLVPRTIEVIGEFVPYNKDKQAATGLRGKFWAERRQTFEDTPRDFDDFDGTRGLRVRDGFDIPVNQNGFVEVRRFHLGEDGNPFYPKDVDWYSHEGGQQAISGPTIDNDPRGYGFLLRNPEIFERNGAQVLRLTSLELKLD